MNGQKDIELIKSYPFVWKERGNEMIKRLNLKTIIKGVPEGVLVSAKVDMGEDKITFTFTFATFDAQVCDSATGEQAEYTLVGFRKENVSFEED